jgi:hypothetical protein
MTKGAAKGVASADEEQRAILKQQSEEAERNGFGGQGFTDLARRIFSVTPEEMQRRVADWEASRAGKGKPGPKPKVKG